MFDLTWQNILIFKKKWLRGKNVIVIPEKQNLDQTLSNHLQILDFVLMKGWFNHCHMYDLFNRGVVNLFANHHYSSFPALNAVIQAEYSHHRRQARSSSSSSDVIGTPLSPLSPISPVETQGNSGRDSGPKSAASPRHQRSSDSSNLHHKFTLHSKESSTLSSSTDNTFDRSREGRVRESFSLSSATEVFARDSVSSSTHEYSSTRESTPRDFEERWELREITRLNSRDSRESRDSRDMLDSTGEADGSENTNNHTRDSSVASGHSQHQHGSNSLPRPKKSSSSSSATENRYTALMFQLSSYFCWGV